MTVRRISNNEHSQAHHADHAGHISLRTYILVFGALMVLMAMTVLAFMLPLPAPFNIIVAMSIASFKTVLIMLFFMHVSVSSRLVQIFAGAAFLWLLMLFGITMADYLARDWPVEQNGPLTTMPHVAPAAQRNAEPWM